MKILTVSSALFLATLAACATSSNAKLAEYEARDRLAAEHLEKFDDLDYNAFSNQQWVDFHKTHADDIVVYWPDGHSTTGFDVHIKDLEAMFVYAPDTRIKEHPVKVANGEWTAVIGVMEGTFTQPMPLPDGTSIAPTGKAFKISMATIGHWNAEGVMTEEYLFWDNATYMKQLGLSN